MLSKLRDFGLKNNKNQIEKDVTKSIHYTTSNKNHYDARLIVKLFCTENKSSDFNPGHVKRQKPLHEVLEWRAGVGFVIIKGL